ncbi:MAG: ATP-binding protein [Desulfobacterales bacterium]
MLQEEDAVLVGVSGGPDSMALLYALLILSRQMSLTVDNPLNHCLRNLDADNDEKFVVSAAETLCIPVFTEKKTSVPCIKPPAFLLKKPQRKRPV